MLAFQVELDDELLAVAGVEDWSVLSFHVNASRSDASEEPFGHLGTAVHGLSLPDAEHVCHHFRWSDTELKVGSRLVVTVVDTDAPTRPLRRYRSDSTVQEDPFTEEEAREMRLQDYLELKKEFGAEHG